MENKLTRKYGLVTAICVIVGTVIGSGVFFKTEDITKVAGSNLGLIILAWIVGGAILLSVMYCFGVLSSRHEKVNGLVDYGEKLVGKKFAYTIGWFLSVVYFPIISAVLSWVAAMYTVILFGWEVSPVASGQTFMFAALYLMLTNVMNTLGPKVAGKFQVSSTFLKLIPLILMAIVGTIVGLVNGTTVDNINSGFLGTEPVSSPFYSALLLTAFAFAGWECVLSLNSEVKDSKRNMRLAIVIGSIVIVAVYILYTIGIYSALPTDQMASGGTKTAFENIFSNVGGTALFVFVIVSCLGTLNGLTMALGRCMYSLAVRKEGIGQELFSQVDKKTNVPNNSLAIGLGVSAVWLVVFGGNFMGWYSLGIDDLVCVFLNIMLLPIIIGMMVKEKGLHWVNRFVVPSVAVCGIVFQIVAAVIAQQMSFVYFLCIMVAVMAIGILFMWLGKKNPKTPSTEAEESAE